MPIVVLVLVVVALGRFSDGTNEPAGKRPVEKSMGMGVMWQVDAGSPGAGGA
jgi:hypothetical protein